MQFRGNIDISPLKWNWRIILIHYKSRISPYHILLQNSDWLCGLRHLYMELITERRVKHYSAPCQSGGRYDWNDEGRMS